MEISKLQALRQRKKIMHSGGEPVGAVVGEPVGPVDGGAAVSPGPGGDVAGVADRNAINTRLVRSGV